MLKFKRFDSPVWCDLPGYPGGKLLIKPTTFKDTTGLLSKVRRKVKVEGEFVDDYDDAAFSYKHFMDVLVDFKGFVFEGVEDKDEQKEILFNYNAIRDFVLEKSRLLHDEAQKALEDDLKN